MAPKSDQDFWDAVIGAFDELTNELRCPGHPRKSAHNEEENKKKINAYWNIFSLIAQHGAAPIVERLKVRVGEYWAENAFMDPQTPEAFARLVSEFAQAYKINVAIVNWASFTMKYAEKSVHHQLPTPVRIEVNKIFKPAVFDTILPQLVSAVTDEIIKEREHEVVNSEDIKLCIDSFKSLGEKYSRNYVHRINQTTQQDAKQKEQEEKDNLELYVTTLEAEHLVKTQEYFCGKAAELLENPSSFVDLATALILNEKKRCERYFHPTTTPKVMRILEEELLLKCKNRIIEDENCGITPLLIAKRNKDVAKMFALYENVDYQNHSGFDDAYILIGNRIFDYIKALGLSINKQFESGSIVDSKEYIEKVLELFDSYHPKAMEITGVNGQARLLSARDLAFTDFFNMELKQTTKTGEVVLAAADRLASYFDRCLSSTRESNDLLAHIDTPIHLVELLEHKDHFSEAYRKAFAKRLIAQSHDADFEVERIILEGMKSIKSGPNITHKLIGMLQDKQNQKEPHGRFLEFAQECGTVVSFEFSAQVLATGQWPSFNFIQCKPPPMIEEIHKSYERFIHKLSKGTKRLQWIYNLSNVVIHRVWKSGRKHLIVSGLQAFILLTLNDYDSITPRTVMDMYSLPRDDVLKYFASTCAKFKILKCTTEGRSESNRISESDVFTVNEAFAAKETKIKLPSPVESTRGQIKEVVDESRKYSTDACIVRIMKARKTMKHADLTAECIRQLSVQFKPDPRLIKDRIQDLIGREYLRRDDLDKASYSYVA